MILSLVATGLFLLSIGSCFLPLFHVDTLVHEGIEFFGALVVFGGRTEVALTSGVYSFSFNTNLPLLVTFQGLLLSAAACYLGGRSILNRIFALVLGLASLIALCFAKTFVLTTSTLESNGLSFGLGFYLALGFAIAANICQGLNLYFFWRAKRG